MSLIKRMIFFLRYNWGAAFILAFMLLIVVSAIYLNFGFTQNSNFFAGLGFYSLILGVILQIASYLIFGNKKYEGFGTPQAPVQFKFSRKYKIIAAVCVVGLVSFASIIAFFPSSIGPIIPVITTNTESPGSFHANVFFAKVFSEPNNQTLVSFGINANGAPAPYTFKTTWADGLVQSNNFGTFSRTISNGQPIPTFATVTITSSNNQSISITVQTPLANVSTSKSFQNASSLTFLETGLPSHTIWSVVLNGSRNASQNNSVVFSNLPNAKYNFSIAYQFNGSINSAFQYSPSAGAILINGTNVTQTVNFTRIPVNQLVTQAAQTNVSISKNVITVPALMINPRNTAQTALRNCRRVATLLIRYTKDRKYRVSRHNSNIDKKSDSALISETSRAQAR